MSNRKKVEFLLVNLITLVRLIGSFIIPILYFKKGINSFALFVFLIFLTDTIDGRLSRFFKVESFLGSLLDSVSDKLFGLIMLAILSYEFPIMLIILILELTILISSILAYSNNKNVKSSHTGKIKTFILDFGISLLFVLLAKDLFKEYISLSFYNSINKSKVNGFTD